MTTWHDCMREMARAYEGFQATTPPVYSHFHLFLVAVGYFRGKKE